MTSVRGEPGQGAPIGILAAAFLFNLGQGVLRPSMPLYLERSFAANYRMVTMIPVVFGAGKWIANLPTGYLLGRLGRPLMVCGLLLIALIDVASVTTPSYSSFLGFRALGGVGWAMFATVATTAVFNLPAMHRRGRAVSVFMMSETSGLVVGSAAGGWLYQGVGVATPFLFEAACMIVAALVITPWVSLSADWATTGHQSGERRLRGSVLRTPGVVLMGMTNALLIAIQTGVILFLFPLYLLKRGSLGPEAVGLLVSLSVLGRLVALWLGGALSDRWGRMRVLIPGLFIYAAFLGTISLLRHPVILGVWSFSTGVAAGAVASVPTALMSDRVPRPLQGVAIGWLRTMTDAGQILGPLVMGALADAIDITAPFIVGSALLAAAAWQCRRRESAMLSAAMTGGRAS